MGLCRAGRYKHRLTGGRINVHKKKRQYELARPPAMTKLGGNRVRKVRTRGGNNKFRALRLDAGNFSWGSENTTRKVRVLDVVYNSTNNELVRTKTLVKNSIVQIDAMPFKQWYARHYGVSLGKKKAGEEEKEKHSRHVVAKQNARNGTQKLEQTLADQFNSGRLFACISSRPGQTGRCDGYILEGEELNFYKKKLEKKKKA